jgi:hypothetical protein
LTEATIAPPLGYEQTAQVLKKFEGLQHPIVLVGGQAVNFWASFYEPQAPELAAHAPYTSKDIDFLGSRDAVRECARRLGGTAKIATLDDMNTPSTGLVLFVDENRHTRQIDFLGSVAGLDDAEVLHTAASATIDDEQGVPIAKFLVMNPMLCLKSRAHNVAYLDGYQTPHAKNQLRAAIICARQFAVDQLASAPVTTLKCNEVFFEIARYGAGVEVFTRYQIDVLEAVVDAPGLPDKFYSERLPRARAAVERARAKSFAAMERARAWAERNRN